MTTGADLRFALAPLTGLHPATFNRYLDDLDAAGLARRSGPGRGIARIALTAMEIANVMLAVTAPLPAGAATAATALGGLFPEDPKEGDASLRTVLAETIENMAALIRQGRSGELGDDDFELILCLNPLRATMVWPSRGPGAVRRYFAYRNETTVERAMQPVPAFRRDTVLTQHLLVAVARIYTDPNENVGSSPKEPTSPAAHTRVPDRSEHANGSETTASPCDFSTLTRSPPPCPPTNMMMPIG